MGKEFEVIKKFLLMITIVVHLLETMKQVKNGFSAQIFCAKILFFRLSIISVGHTQFFSHIEKSADFQKAKF